MADGEFSWIHLSVLTFGLLAYELVCFVGFLSLSIGIQAGLTQILKIALNYNLHVAWQSFSGWYILALSTQVHLRFYRKFIYPKIRNVVRANRTFLQGLPRIIYFVLYCFSIYGVSHEYEATHGYPPMVLKTKRHNNIMNDALPEAVVTPAFTNVGMSLHKHRSRQMTQTYAQKDFALEGPNHTTHTFLFLAEMSYMIYSSSQVLSIFLIRLMKDVPHFPLLPQIYAAVSMTILQSVLTLFYSFPMVMTLIACHMFHVEALSTYMFTLCLALSVAMATSQLESESPFPTQAKIGPYYYFEGIHRARIHLILCFLPPISYYFFQDHKSYPLTANDTNFTIFTFWIMTALMHTVKSLYMTTWRPVPLVPGNIQNAQRPAEGGAPIQRDIVLPLPTERERNLSISYETRDNIVIVNEAGESRVKESMDDDDGVSREKLKKIKLKKLSVDTAEGTELPTEGDAVARPIRRSSDEVNADNANLHIEEELPAESEPLKVNEEPLVVFELKRSESDCANKNMAAVQLKDATQGEAQQLNKHEEPSNLSVQPVTESLPPLKSSSLEESPVVLQL